MYGIGEFAGLAPEHVVEKYEEEAGTNSPSPSRKSSAPTTNAPISAAPVSPTTSPVASEGEDSGGNQAVGRTRNWCFSAYTTLDVLEDVKLYDKVFTGSKYQPVYSFGHLDKEISMDSLQIYTDDKVAPIELSPDLLIYLDAKDSPVRADKVGVGDKLKAMHNNIITSLPSKLPRLRPSPERVVPIYP